MFGSPGTLVTSLICSSIGLGLFIYGWRQRSTVPAVGGALIVVAAYFCETVLQMCAVTALLLAGTWWFARRGD